MNIQNYKSIAKYVCLRFRNDKNNKKTKNINNKSNNGGIIEVIIIV